MKFVVMGLRIMLVYLICFKTAFAFFCPKNFIQIEYGQSSEDVSKICPPDKIELKDAPQDSGPQEWTYYIPQSVMLSGGQPSPGTLKTTVSFDRSGKAVNISVNGIGVGESTICGNDIQLGNNRDQIKTACGVPSFINKESTDPKQPPVQNTIFIYNTNPPVRLIFQGGKLISRE